MSNFYVQNSMCWHTHTFKCSLLGSALIQIISWPFKSFLFSFSLPKMTWKGHLAWDNKLSLMTTKPERLELPRSPPRSPMWLLLRPVQPTQPCKLNPCLKTNKPKNRRQGQGWVRTSPRGHVPALNGTSVSRHKVRVEQDHTQVDCKWPLYRPPRLFQDSTQGTLTQVIWWLHDVPPSHRIIQQHSWARLELYHKRAQEAPMCQHLSVCTVCGVP